MSKVVHARCVKKTPGNLPLWVRRKRWCVSNLAFVIPGLTSPGRLPKPRTSVAFPTHGSGYILPIDPSPRDWIVPCGCIFFSWREMIATLETVKDLTGQASLREAAKAYAVLTRGVLLHSPTSKSSRYHSILTFTLDYETRDSRVDVEISKKLEITFRACPWLAVISVVWRGIGWMRLSGRANDKCSSLFPRWESPGSQ